MTSFTLSFVACVATNESSPSQAGSRVGDANRNAKLTSRPCLPVHEPEVNRGGTCRHSAKVHDMTSKSFENVPVHISLEDDVITPRVM